MTEASASSNKQPCGGHRLIDEPDLRRWLLRANNRPCIRSLRLIFMSVGPLSSRRHIEPDIRHALDCQ